MNKRLKRIVNSRYWYGRLTPPFLHPFFYFHSQFVVGKNQPMMAYKTRKVKKGNSKKIGSKR